MSKFVQLLAFNEADINTRFESALSGLGYESLDDFWIDAHRNGYTPSTFTIDTTNDVPASIYIVDIDETCTPNVMIDIEDTPTYVDVFVLYIFGDSSGHTTFYPKEVSAVLHAGNLYITNNQLEEVMELI